MTGPLSILRRIGRDKTGSTLVEFAMLAPLFFAMLFGLFQVAVLIQNYNALRSAGDDLSRYVVVQYQKGSTLTEAQIQTAAVGIAAGKPYFLDTSSLAVNSSQSSSAMAGADKITLNLALQSADFLHFFGVKGITLHFNKDLYVPSS